MISIVTYNTLLNKAFGELVSVLKQSSPDILCLQEVDTSEANLNKLERIGYQLADFSNSFIKYGRVFGVATYFNPQKLKLITSESYDLPRSIVEALLVLIRGGNNQRSVLKTEFFYKPKKKKIVLYNAHLSVFGSNGTRLKQLTETLENLNNDNDQQSAMIVAGDFNYYPLRRKKLEELIHSYGFREATNNISYTFNRDRYEDSFMRRVILRIIPRTHRSKLDYILFKNVRLIITAKLNFTYSDHDPIFSQFRF